MNFQQIEKEMKEGTLTPPQMAEYRDILSAEMSAGMDELLRLQIQYAEYFQFSRETVKSDKACLMKWRGTEAGKREMELEVEHKRMKVLLQALSGHLRVSENVARNIY